MKIKRIAMSESDEQTLDKLKKKFKMNNDEILSFCIQTTNAKVMENDQLHFEILKCLEYIKLLVKTSHNLPTRSNEQEMQRIVSSSSRFEEMIVNKIKDEKKL